MSASIEGLLRDAAPQALGAVVRRFGDFAASEDAVQEALIDAAAQWPAQGSPDNPVGWLIHVATRRMLDTRRSEDARRRREELAAGQDGQDPTRQPSVGGHDDTLILMFMCCHPSLSSTSAIALTLRAVGGLTTEEIARAFLVPPATIGQRISRAKQSIRASGIPFALPAGAEWVQRRRSVLHVLYLIFNEGYLTTSGTALARSELSGEAIRLTRMIARALPEHPEVDGLLALMLLTEARRPARTDARGQLVPLANQDRTRWDRELIAEGSALIAAAWRRGAVGEYQAQAAIAAVHDDAADPQDTDWPEIVALYGLLERMTDNPMVSLGRVVATSMADGPDAGLALLEPLEPRLGDHHRRFAVRAHLRERAGDLTGATADYERAAARTTSVPEQQYLLTQAARLRHRER